MTQDDAKNQRSEVEREQAAMANAVLGHLGLDLDDEAAAAYHEQPGRYCQDALSKLPIRLAVRHAILELPDKNRTVVEKLLEQIEAGHRANLNQIADELRQPYATTYEQLGRALVVLAEALRHDPAVREYYGDKPLDRRPVVSGIYD